LKSFDVAASSIQLKVFDYLSSLEWIRAQQNLAIIGPAGTGKCHTLIGRGVAADAGMFSSSNLKDLDAAELGFIVGSRSVKAPTDLASHFHWGGDFSTD
jgi:hypothetical protein